MRQTEICRIEWPDVDIEQCRLFEAAFSIQQVAIATGHKDWRMLRRYTNLEPEDLHKMQTAAQPSMKQFVATLVTGA
jgi:hypothetical protein